MTDKELDDLEALLVERAENLNDPEAYHRDIAEVMLKAADAIAELREKNAALVGALRGITPNALQDGWWCPECQDWIAVATNHECCPSCGTYLTDVQPSQEWHTKALAALKENTQ